MKRLFFSVVAVLVFFALPGLSAEARETIPSEYFSRLPSVTSVKLSPGGDKLAAIINLDEESYVAVQMLNDGKLNGLTKTGNEKFKVHSFQWLNNDYLGIIVTFNEAFQGKKVGRSILLSQHYSGQPAASPLTRPRRDEINPQYHTNIVDLMPNDPNHILMGLNYDDWSAKSVYKVEVGSKQKRKRVQRHRRNAVRWISDRENEVRGYVSFLEDTYRIYLRPDDEKKMKLLWQYEALSKQEIFPLGFANDPDILFVNAYNDMGYRAVFKVDISDPELALQPVYSVDGRDVSSSLLTVNATGEVIGVSSSFEKGGYHFFDKTYKKLVEAVDKSIVDQQELLLGMSDDGDRMLFFSWESNFPGEYSIFDRQSKRLKIVAQRYPELREYKLARKLPVSYQSSDGVPIAGFLTLPFGVENSIDDIGIEGEAVGESYPTIIFPHGGPISEDGNEFDYWAQFFASRGYAVFQMNFRGSSGYGYNFMSAGFENWGRVMQDDVTDGVQWLVDKGIADKNRICIAGASYGGYAALMGLAKTPDLYRCGISFAGVTDLPALLTHSLSFSNKEIVKKQLGKKRSILRENSPVHLAKNITAPVLIMHGKQDISVPFKQAKRMKKALKKSSAEVEYLVLEEGDHYLSKQADRHEVFRAMDEFLARHLPAD